MDYSIIQEMRQKRREEIDDEYWLFMSGEMSEEQEEQLAFPGYTESNLARPTDSESQDDDLLF